MVETKKVSPHIADDPSLNLRHGALSQQYELHDVIGSGAHGRAILATRREDDDPVVVKEIRLSDMDEKGRAEALKEVRLLSQFDHVNIIHYYECILEDGCLNIVMEYAGCGDLSEVVNKRAVEKKPLTEDEIMFWFVQIVLALFHVHSKNILHRDLKSQNIFIAEGNILKLGDFGISRVLNSDTELARTVIGTPYYLSPEICEDRPYNRKSDVWALGCVLYELCTLKHAFNGQSLPALIVRILKGKYPPVPTRYSTPIRGLVDSMLKQDPKDRPSVDAILRLAYVRQHVERYAQHVMALTPLQPPSLGITVKLPADDSPNKLGRTRCALPRGSGGSTPVASRPTHGRRSIAGLGPEQAAPQRNNHERAETQGAAEAAKPAAPAYGRRHVMTPDRSKADGPSGPRPKAPAQQSPAPVHGRRQQAVPDAAAGQAGPRAVAPPALAAPVPAVGPSPAKPMVSTWINRQNAALQELEGAFQRRGGAMGPAAAALEAASEARAAPASAAPPPAPAVEQAETVSGRAQLLTLKQQQRDADLEANKQAVQQVREERERKKQISAQRSKEAAAAVRARTTERQREVEQHLLEQRAEEERRLKKAAEAAQNLKLKEDQKRKLREDIVMHMAAHKEQVKQARSRVSRDELAKMGAEFAARMQPSVVPSGTGVQVVVVDVSSPRTPAPLAGAFSPSPQAAARRHSAKGTSRLQGGAKASPAGRDSPAAGAARSSEPPPWKMQRSKSGPGPPGGFPEVEIYTPFGSDLPQAKEERPGSSRPSSRQAQRLPVIRPKMRSKMEVLELLSQIQDVLAEEPDEEEQPAAAPAAAAAAAAGAATPGANAAVRTRPAAAAASTKAVAPQGLRLPPEKDVGEGPAVAESGQGRGNNAAKINAQKVESLRMTLDQQLGSKVFMEGYRYLRDIQHSGEQDGEEEVSTQKGLENILGAKLFLARLIHKLITLEDAVFD